MPPQCNGKPQSEKSKKPQPKLKSFASQLEKFDWRICRRPLSRIKPFPIDIPLRIN